MSRSRASDLPPDVRVVYPFASRTIDLPSGATMHYVDEGRGPVVLMLHGNPTWSFHYRSLIRHLGERGFRCIAPDHIGCGLSDKPVDYPYVLKQRIDDVEALVDALELSSFSLVVHDWGGAIGCGLAVRRPERLNKLVLLNTAAFRSKRIPLRIAAVKIPLLGEGIIRGLNGFAGPAARMSVRTPLEPVAQRGLLWPYSNWRDRVAVWNFVKDIPLSPHHPSFPTLAEIEDGLGKLRGKPVAIEWGERDFCFNRHFLERWKAIFPDAEVRTHEGAGHYVLEDAGVVVAERIERFLAR